MDTPIKNLTILQYLERISDKYNDDNQQTSEFKNISDNVISGGHGGKYVLKFFNVSVGVMQLRYKSEFDSNKGNNSITFKNLDNAIYRIRAKTGFEQAEKLGFSISSDKKICESLFGDSDDHLTLNSTMIEFCTALLKLTSEKDIIKDYFKKVFDIDMDAVLMKEQLKTKINAGIKQIILHGAPGTGKTFTAKQFAKEYVNDVKKVKKQIEVVQFHPTYDYTDFVEGLRPVQLTPDGNPTFVRMDGAFKKFCRKAAEDKNESNKYFFIIDEINRGDVSKILGELMYLMNDPKRTHEVGKEVGKEVRKHDTVETPYKNLPTYYIDKNGKPIKYCDIDENEQDNKQDDKQDDKQEQETDIFKDGFFIPNNVIIIGTMNDIDRSVDAFDFALRRRFAFIKADANAEASASMASILHKNSDEDVNNVTVSTCIKSLEALNRVISGDNGKKLGLSDDYHIGAAYFAGFDGDFTSLFENSIAPLIREYCRGKNQDSVEKFVQSCRMAFTVENTVK